MEILTHDCDHYGRLVGDVLAAGRSLITTMEQAGQAVMYDCYCSDSRYPAAERLARQAAGRVGRAGALAEAVGVASLS